jgi:hypothetical protein
LGFFSYLFEYIFGRGQRDIHIGKMESLREQLPALLNEMGVPLANDARAYLDSAPRSNTSEHAASATYYDTSLMELVRRKDASVIERFGYSEP